jgi:enamine deaminase RidA (YjgF/YER057c/UK114 family)
MANQPQVELIRSSRLAARAPYAYAAVARDCSRLVFTAGACLLDESGETVAVGDVAGQAEQVMANLLPWTVPALASRTWSKQPSTLRATTRPICSLHVEVVSRHFCDHDAPSTLVGVAALGYREQLVEVEAIAALP